MPKKKTAPVAEKAQTKKKAAEPKKGSIPVYDIEGKAIGSIELSKEIFTIKAHDGLIAQYVRVYLANQRQGTQSVKTRAEVIGSTRKIYRQKGTGRARHGSRKAPIFVGGGAAHAPKPRNYRLTMNKKQKTKALHGVLSRKADQKNIVVVDGLLDIEPKTKNIVTLLHNLSLKNDRSVLFVAPQGQHGFLKRAVRNISYADYMTSHSLNAYTVLKYAHIIFAKEALAQIQKTQSV